MFLARGISPNSRAGYAFLNIEPNRFLQSLDSQSGCGSAKNSWRRSCDRVVGSLAAAGTCRRKEEILLPERASAVTFSFPGMCSAEMQKPYSIANRCSPLSRCKTNATVLLPEVMAWTTAMLSHLKRTDFCCH